MTNTEIKMIGDEILKTLSYYAHFENPDKAEMIAGCMSVIKTEFIKHGIELDNGR